VTGSTATKWGAERARDGHPRPFPLHYVEIGNEDWFDTSGSYDGRFAQFAAAIRKRYPELKLIATTPVKGARPDVIDEHYYRTPQEFFADTHHYDQASRTGPKIMVGEWATTEGTPTPDFGAALSDAAWMTGLERNSDVVVMASYAPLFVNVNAAGAWGTNLIGYDALHSYGSPSYYAQVLFSRYRGDEVVASQLVGAGPLCFYSATRDAAGRTLYLKIVNASPQPQPLTLHLEGAASIAPTGTLVTLAAKTTLATNTLSDPDQIVPHTERIRGLGREVRHTFAPYSINVVEIGVTAQTAR
jgi:alpha-L-arabinofuranosidase